MADATRLASYGVNNSEDDNGLRAESSNVDIIINTFISKFLA